MTALLEGRKTLGLGLGLGLRVRVRVRNRVRVTVRVRIRLKNKGCGQYYGGIKAKVRVESELGLRLCIG